MSEIINNKKVFSLVEVMRSIQKTITERYGSAFWVKAEMNKLNFYNHSGHCYPELVERVDGKVITEIRSHLWKSDYERINQNFLKTLKEPLKDGIKILFLAKVIFDPKYGLSLWIQDIDPGYTLGDLEKEKQETIQRLKLEGIFDKNKKLKLALLPQRIAVISVETSKGYADFLKVIEHNNWHYKFFHILFPSLLQGDKAAEQIIGQLRKIEKIIHHFDAAAIIRGGGGDVGLSCYNNYHLAKEIANFPLPVLTGIGHSTNETVAEMVAFSNNITPTHLGEFLIQKFHDFSVPVQDAQKLISNRAERILTDENIRLESLVRLFRSDSRNLIERNKNEIKNSAVKIQTGSLGIVSQSNLLLNMHTQQIGRTTSGLLKDENSELLRLNQRIQEKSKDLINVQKQQLGFIERNVENLSPKNILKRGFSISLRNGKSITDATLLKKGDEIETILYEGKIISTVKITKNTEES